MQAQTLRQFLRRKPVKITGIILLSLLALFIIALSVISIYVQNNKTNIIARVKQEFARRVSGDLTIGDIDLSVWTNFPNIAVKVKNVAVKDSLYKQPLLKATEISCAINIFQLASPKPDIARVTVTGALFHLFVDSAGYNNDYLLKPKKKVEDTSKAEPAGEPIVIHRIDLKDFTFISEDKKSNKRFGVKVRTGNAAIKRRDSVLVIAFNEECLVEGLGFNLDKGVYVGNTAIKGKWQMQFYKSAKVLMINESPAEINGNDFRIAAEFHFGGDSSYFKLHAKTEKILFKDARALLTEKIQTKLKFVDVATPMQVDAKLTGALAHGGDPFVHVECKAVNSILITPVTTFTDCNFTGVFDNRINPAVAPGDPNSVVYFPQFAGKWNNLSLQGDSIRIDNLSTATLNFHFNTACNFNQLDDALNLQNISFDDGKAKLDLKYNGPLLTDASIFAGITGALHIENGKLTYVPHNLQFINCNGDLAFSKNSIAIQKITCDYKSNHFELTGSGGLGRISGQDDGNAAIVCNLFCPSFNMADFKTVFAKTSTRKVNPKKKSMASAFTGIDNILEKGDIRFNINAKQILLHNFAAQNANVSLLLQPNDWHIQRASLNFGGGSFIVDATLHRTGKNFLVTTHCDIKEADVRKAFYAFDNFGQDGILYSNLRGTLNTNAAITMQVDDKGAITPGTMKGKVDFNIRNGALINYTPVLAIQDYALKNRDLNNIEFAEIKNNLTVNGNQVVIPRMEIASTAMRLYVEGVYGVMHASPTDISIQVPLSNLNSKSLDKKPGNKGVDAKVGPSVYLRAKSKPDGKVKVGLDLFRKFRKGKETTGNG